MRFSDAKGELLFEVDQLATALCSALSFFGSKHKNGEERSQLERELATLRGETLGAKAGGPPGENQKPIAPPLQPVALRESTPPDCESYQSTNDIQER